MLYKCRNCGGNAVYAPDKGKMYCPHCESEDSEDQIMDDSMERCVNCGAPLQITDYTSACRCEHCGMYLIFNERVEGGYEPHLVLPFRVSRHLAAAAMDQEFKNRLFAPSDFMSAKSLQKMEGTYVPFWLYDYDADYDYAGEGTKVRTWRNGNTEYTETSYYEVQRRMNVDFDRIPVDASYAMEDGTMDLMEPYDYKALKDFEAKYLSGFYGEVYNQKAGELEERALQKARTASEQLMQASLNGYVTMRPYRRNLNLKNRGEHYALLPVWQYFYRYRDQVYEYHVNGQTGKVVGVTPVSKGKVLLYAASVFAVVTAACQIAVQVMEIL